MPSVFQRKLRTLVLSATALAAAFGGPTFAVAQSSLPSFSDPASPAANPVDPAGIDPTDPMPGRATDPAGVPMNGIPPTDALDMSAPQLAPRQNGNGSAEYGQPRYGEQLPQGGSEFLAPRPAPSIRGDAYSPSPEHAPLELAEFENPPAAVCSSACDMNLFEWFVREEFTYLHRGRARETQLGATATGSATISTASARLGWAAGSKTTLGTFLGRDCNNRDHSAEFSYHGFFDWQGDRVIESTPGNFIFGTFTFPGFGGVDSLFTSASSSLHSFEANYRIRTRLGRDAMVLTPDGNWTQHLTPGLTHSYLFGLRYIQIDEDYRIRGRVDGIPDAQFASDYDVDTHNDLFGFQAGGEVLSQQVNWNAGVRGKVGLMYNAADSITDVRLTNVFNPTTGFSGEDHDSSLSFVGEVGFLASYQFRPNMSARIAYDFMLITEVALASNQVRLNQDTSIDLTGNVLYHGLSVGFDYTW